MAGVEIFSIRTAEDYWFRVRSERVRRANAPESEAALAQKKREAGLKKQIEDHRHAIASLEMELDRLQNPTCMSGEE